MVKGHVRRRLQSTDHTVMVRVTKVLHTLQMVQLSIYCQLEERKLFFW
jgi:hypothetical protein